MQLRKDTASADRKVITRASAHLDAISASLLASPHKLNTFA